MPAARLKMQSVSKSFGRTRALRTVDLEVAPGEVLALVGENGAGKSTLMKVLSGAHQPDSGQMWLDGDSYRPRNPSDARAAGVGMIYQELSLAPHLSVMENILLGVESTTGPFVNWRLSKSRAKAALTELGLGDMDVSARVSDLSIGRQQMVEIARAIALDCRVLVLDEPTSSLTASDIEQLFALIRRLRSQGMSIIYISHFLEEVKEISDRITVLRDGESVGSADTAETTPDEIVSLMVGREVSELYPRSERSLDGDVVLSLKSLTGSKYPVDASMELKRGSVFGIFGLVGAGRTKLLRALFGLEPIRAGEIKVGTLSGSANPADRWRQSIGMVSEDRKLEGLAQNLSIAAHVGTIDVQIVVVHVVEHDLRRQVVGADREEGRGHEATEGLGHGLAVLTGAVDVELGVGRLQRREEGQTL
ncbi:MAG: sugar ABC transporter ATP-binding protein, partial [Planctomycetota bacterium]